MIWRAAEIGASAIVLTILASVAVVIASLAYATARNTTRRTPKTKEDEDATKKG